MGNWIQCTTSSGEKVLLNFDSALWMRQNRWGTDISLGAKPIRIEETPAELMNMGLKSPRMRAVHGAPAFRDPLHRNGDGVAGAVPAIEGTTLSITDVPITRAVSEHVQTATSGEAESVEW
jgi:hypothetical protein